MLKDVKKLIKSGKLKAYNMGNDIYLKDVETEEIVRVGEYEKTKGGN